MTYIFESMTEAHDKHTMNNEDLTLWTSSLTGARVIALQIEAGVTGANVAARVVGACTVGGVAVMRAGSALVDVCRQVEYNTASYIFEVWWTKIAIWSDKQIPKEVLVISADCIAKQQYVTV